MKPLTLIRIVNISFVIFTMLIPFRSFAGLINFETTASGETPIDNATIAFDDYFTSDGLSVSFGFDTNTDGVLDSNAVYEKIKGGKEAGNSGFISAYGNRYDEAATGSEALLGDFFLRQAHAYKPFGTFHIIYNAINPVTSASGEIWDIDGRKHNTEQFFVEAFNGTNSLASIFSPLGSSSGRHSLDGKPWVFGFNNLNNITRIEISFIGSKKKGIGLAFNNFSPIEDLSVQKKLISEPSILTIFSFGIILLLSRRLKKH